MELSTCGTMYAIILFRKYFCCVVVVAFNDLFSFCLFGLVLPWPQLNEKGLFVSDHWVGKSDCTLWYFFIKEENRYKLNYCNY